MAYPSLKTEAESMWAMMRPMELRRKIADDQEAESHWEPAVTSSRQQLFEFWA